MSGRMDGNLYALDVYLRNEEEQILEYEAEQQRLYEESLEENFDPDTDGSEVTVFGGIYDEQT